jgi:hypothetical protein
VEYGSVCGSGEILAFCFATTKHIKMLRSKAIPEILDRICDDESIGSALFLNSDGELLGTNSAYNDAEEMGTLLVDIALDYQYLGEEYATIEQGEHQQHQQDLPQKPPIIIMSQLQFALIEMDGGLVGIVACPAIECFVIAISKSTKTCRGLMMARLKELSTFLQDSLTPLIELGP